MTEEYFSKNMKNPMGGKSKEKEIYNLPGKEFK